MSIEQGRDISELFRRVSKIIRIGKVMSVDYNKAKAKVKIGNLTTEYLPWLTPSTSAWIPLRNGEQVLVLSPNGDLKMGIILPALYQSSKSPPAHDSNKITFNVDVAYKGAISATGNITTSGKVTSTGEVEGQRQKVINTGNNAQYLNLWGKKEYSNKKIKYLTPGLDYEKCVSQTRLLQYKSPKIIISKLTKHIVASLDIKGEFASTNTTFIYNPTQNYDLYVLCAILNSKMMEVVFKTMFSGMNLLGSMQVQAPQARLLPLPGTLNNSIKESIKQIVCNIIAKKQADENTDNEEEQLNQMIYKLYDLTPEEIAEVEKLYPSDKGPKND